MMWNGYGTHGGGWMVLFALLLLGGLVLIGVVSIRLLGNGQPPASRGQLPGEHASGARSATGSPGEPGGPGGPGTVRSAARQILDDRYARGELTTQEYQERVQALAHSGS
jgi:putative membrane protein